MSETRKESITYLIKALYHHDAHTKSTPAHLEFRSNMKTFLTSKKVQKKPKALRTGQNVVLQQSVGLLLVLLQDLEISLVDLLHGGISGCHESDRLVLILQDLLHFGTLDQFAQDAERLVASDQVQNIAGWRL